MKYEYYNQFINKETKGRCDITPIFENPEVFSNLLNNLIEPFRKLDFDNLGGAKKRFLTLGNYNLKDYHII